jgi:hypothetical protein
MAMACSMRSWSIPDSRTRARDRASRSSLASRNSLTSPGSLLPRVMYMVCQKCTLSLSRERNVSPQHPSRETSATSPRHPTLMAQSPSEPASQRHAASDERPTLLNCCPPHTTHRVVLGQMSLLDVSKRGRLAGVFVRWVSMQGLIFNTQSDSRRRMAAHIEVRVLGD